MTEGQTNKPLTWGLYAVLLGLAGLLAWFCWGNLNLYWESSHPPEGAELHDVVVTHVEIDEYCGRTSRSTSRCVKEVDGVDFTGPDGAVHHADAHTDYASGDKVRAFRDSDGDWQVKGAFNTAWVLRTAGLTGIGSLVLAGMVVGSLVPRPSRRVS